MLSIKLPYAKLLFILLIQLTFTISIRGQDEEKSVTIDGYTEVYYLYNFHQPLTNMQPSFIYNFNRTNEVNLNLGFIKAAYNKDKVRANLALMLGTYAQANLAAEPDVLRHIFEANIGVKLSAKGNLWLDAGIFPSHIGFESAIAKDNYNLSRSLLAENSPYYEAGLKLGYTSKNEKWFLSALLLNGWQRIKRPDGNTTPAFGTQLTYKPSTSVTLNSSSFIGNDKPDSIRQMRYFHNLYGIFQLSKKLSLITGFDIGAQQKSRGSSQMNTWYSPVIIPRYSASDKLTLAARAEYYSDRNGVIISTGTSNGFKTFGYSANVDYAIQKEVLWRIEARSLRSKDNIFETRNNLLVSAHTWLTTSLSLAF